MHYVSSHEESPEVPKVSPVFAVEQKLFNHLWRALKSSNCYIRRFLSYSEHQVSE